jgi:hypothetical protein
LRRIFSAVIVSVSFVRVVCDLKLNS